MAVSHGVEKSRAASFRDRLSESASTHNVPLLAWGIPLLALLGCLTWWIVVEPESEWDVLVASPGIILLAYAAKLFVFDTFSRPKDKPADDLPTSSWHDIAHLTYVIGALITGFIVFIASWIYCIATYGFLFGVGLGWLPSLIVAYIAGLLWPLLVIAVLLLIALILK
jgi:hypothetical protein